MGGQIIWNFQIEQFLYNILMLSSFVYVTTPKKVLFCQASIDAELRLSDVNSFAWSLPPLLYYK